MVFFNCNACGEALKKNQVEKHLLRCRQCQTLSCVDCGKDFRGNDYQTHTKCMTEEEKYCGKGYVPKINKGEVKQEQWIEKVQLAIQKSLSNPKLKGVLESLKDYPNIPRKKVKFENFLKNSLRIKNPMLVTQVWDVLMAAAGQNQEEESKEPQNSINTANGIHEVSDLALKPSIDNPGKTEAVDHSEDNCGHKLNKRERKEERKQKANKKEKKDKTDEEGQKKGKKRKHSEKEENTLEEIDLSATNCEQADKQKKKKKEHRQAKDEEPAPSCDDINGSQLDDINNNEDTGEVTKPDKKKRKVKFNWETTIIDVLKSKGEMSLKKLRKKVLNEFAAQDAANHSDENLKAKFDKKILKIAQVKVSKDRVKLK